MQLRKKKGYTVLADVNESGVINEDRPSKFLLEIAYSLYQSNKAIYIVKISNFQ